MGIRDLFADTRPLSVPAFRRLWTANIATQLGAQLTVVAVPTHIYALTESSAYVGLTGVFGLVPLVVFGLYGGSIADALDKRTVLTATTTGMIITAAGFWLLTLTGLANVWLLLSLFAVQQACFAVNMPTRNAAYRSILPIAYLPAATSLNMTVMNGGAIVGPLIAGALIPMTGHTWIYFIDTVLLLPTLAAVLALPALPAVPDQADGSVDKPGLRSVISGLHYLHLQPILLAALLVDVVAMAFGMPRILYPEIAAEDFGGSAVMLSLLYSSMAVGAVLGGVFSGWVSRVSRQGRAVFWCVVVWGAVISIAGVAVIASPNRVTMWAFVVVAMMMIGGAADMFSASLRNAMAQQSATLQMQGRVQGVYTVAVVGGPRLGDALHGWVAEYAGAGLTTLAGGLLVIVFTVVIVWRIPEFWRYERPG